MNAKHSFILGEIHSSPSSIFHSMDEIHQLLFELQLSFIINIYKDVKKGCLDGKIKHLFEIMSNSYFTQPYMTQICLKAKKKI
jgi:hypothetical protein